jgi:uncharacterized protein YdbL (DUF1318 family)
MKTRVSSLGPLALAVWLSGCLAVTVNVTFPQESIDGAASSIEGLVRGGAVPPVPKTPPPPGRQGGAPARSWWAALAAPTVAEAQVPEIKTYTPEVQAIVASRRARYPQLAAAMASGCLGENAQGLVEPRPGTGCPPNVAALAAAENADRLRLYRTLVEQNKMPPGDIARVQAAFAKTNRAAAPTGTWVQDDSGHWSRK